MSNNSTPNDPHQDEELKQDEAFIDSLYQQLPDEQPSAELDQRILAAARQAAEAPDVVIQKRPRWLKPMASAAAVLLVVTVSVHQIFDPTAPLHVASTGMVLEQQNMNELDFAADAVEEISESEPEFAALSAPAPVMAKAKKAYVAEEAAERLAVEQKLAREQRQKAMPRKQAASRSMAGGADLMLEEVVVEGAAIEEMALFSDSAVFEVDMTPELLQQLKQQETVWRLIEQDEEGYRISLKDSNQVYRLSRQAFTIDSDSVLQPDVDYSISLIGSIKR